MSRENKHESTVIVYAPGDPTVGWPAYEVEVKVPDFDDILENVPELKEYLRERLKETFGTLYDDSGTKVYFEGESEDRGT